MTITIIAPDNIHNNLTYGYTVFLGGAIDMGNAVNWQDVVVKELDGLEKLILINQIL